MRLDALASLDIEGSGRFALSEHHTDDLVPAAEMPHEQVAMALEDVRYFMVRVAHGRHLSVREADLLQQSWAAQQGLIMGDDLHRLLWIVGHFRAEIEYDLLQRVGVDLADLWQRRQWRRLLNMLDRLPRTTWTQQGLANHPEYAAMVAQGVAGRKQDDDEEGWSPSLLEHTPEVAALASVVDAVNALRSTLVMVNSEKGKKPPVIPPYPRPRTLVDTMVAKAQREARWTAHERLAARVLRRDPQP